MPNIEQVTIPRYLKIAVDISARIASGDIAEGDKLKGRSILATEYNVSPETIRRSMSVLADKNVVKIAPGIGIIVISKEYAIQFVKSFKDGESEKEMSMKLSQMIEKRKSIDEDIITITKQIIDMYKYKRSDLIKPVEIEVPKYSKVIGKSIGELEIWHNTGATIIGIVQNNNIIISPGPYYEFSDKDSILIVGDENVVERFNNFINSK